MVNHANHKIVNPFNIAMVITIHIALSHIHLVTKHCIIIVPLLYVYLIDYAFVLDTCSEKVLP
jgi:hypothetical protein